MSTLTKEQEKLVDAYGTEMLKNGIKAGVKTDRKKAEKSVKHLYEKYLDVAPPKKIVFVKSPEAAIKAVAKETKQEPKELVNEILFLNFWTWWVAYYSAGINILGESCEEGLVKDLEVYEDITKSMHAILPCDTTCFVIEYPKKVCVKDNDLDKFVLHRDGGLALEYTDGTGFAWLNGVEVPDWVATTPAKKLSVAKLLAEPNVDIRREGLKRIGIATALKKLKAVTVDRFKGKKKWEDYTLVEADFGDRKRRFLNMRNPSTGDFVPEQVPMTCNTVAEANAFRCRETKYIEPAELT